MELMIKPSDLKFKYRRDVLHRNEAKYLGGDDPAPFNRDDLYDILAMLTAVMNALQSDNGRLLHLLEETLNDMPRCVVTRGEVFAYLRGTAEEVIGF